MCTRDRLWKRNADRRPDGPPAGHPRRRQYFPPQLRRAGDKNGYLLSITQHVFSHKILPTLEQNIYIDSLSVCTNNSRLNRYQQCQLMKKYFKITLSARRCCILKKLSFIRPKTFKLYTHTGHKFVHPQSDAYYTVA